MDRGLCSVDRGPWTVDFFLHTRRRGGHFRSLFEVDFVYRLTEDCYGPWTIDRGLFYDFDYSSSGLPIPVFGDAALLPAACEDGLDGFEDMSFISTDKKIGAFGDG